MFKMRSSFLRIPNHQRFDYQPRYYDAEKEELEQRIKELNLINEQASKSEFHKEQLSRKFREARKQSLVVSQGNKMKYRLRIILIISILSYICYYLIS